MIIKRLSKHLIITLIVLLVILSFIGSTFAIGILVSPGGFQINYGSSHSYSNIIDVENTGDESLNIIIDKKRLLTDNVHLEFSDTGIAEWITVDPSNFTLAPHEKKQVKFTVKIPSDVNYSDALGGLVVNGYPLQNQENDSSNLNFQVQQVPQIVIPLAVGFPGPIIESLTLVQKNVPSFLLSFMQGNFVYQIQNNGTVYENMTGDVDIKGWYNEHHLNMTGGVYPDDRYYLKTNWTPGILDLGFYDAKTTINYGRYNETKTIISHNTIFVFPVWLLLLICLALVVYVLRKKEVSSPINIKIERKK